MKTNHQQINQDSGDVEYYTPSFIVEAARKVLGGIDLDPFSSVDANKRVKAFRFFTVQDNGLEKQWGGRVWMNHPFGRKLNGPCIQKIVSEYKAGRIVACCITFASTSEMWFQPLMKFPQCYLSPRTNYHLPDGSLKRGVTKGSVVTYFGTDVESFRREFSPFGTIKI